MFFSSKTETPNHPDYPKFPLDLRIGAILAVDVAEALRFEGLDLSFTPPQDEMLVSSLSAMPLFGLNIVRAYCRHGDDTILAQFNMSGDGTLNDVSLFRLLEEIRPATEDEWGMWLDPGGLIGGKDLNAPNGMQYQRQWGEGEAASPVECRELVFTDPKAAPREVSHRMMLYAREVGQENENLLLSADAETDEALIRAWVGLDLSSFGVKVY